MGVLTPKSIRMPPKSLKFALSSDYTLNWTKKNELQPGADGLHAWLS